MIAEARQFMFRNPWCVAAPGIAIALAALGFNLFGDALRDILDPRGRQR
jgi:peptide/nickel transport system permease protein